MNNYCPNERLIGMPGSRAMLATPALILDLDALEHNIGKMAGLCAENGIALRPHAKTHKSVKIASMQLAAGAAGVCVANMWEAHVMAAADLGSIHLSSPPVGDVQLGELISLIAGGADISVVANSVQGLEALDRHVTDAGLMLTVLVDVDLGSMYRTGVANSAAALDLAVRISQSASLIYGGVQFYSGIVQHIEKAQDRSGFYGQQLGKLQSLVDMLADQGLRPPVVSGGGTGTVLIDGQSGVITENQAGSYAVMDVEYGDIEMLADNPEPFLPALFVQATVISNNARGMVTIDAGSKSISTDGPKPRVARGAPADSMYQLFGDEHGVIISPDAMDPAIMQGGPPQAGADKQMYELFYDIFGQLNGEPGQLEIGAKVELTAPHCDPTINLHNFYHCVRGDTLVDIWPVDARGNL